MAAAMRKQVRGVVRPRTTGRARAPASLADRGPLILIKRPLFRRQLAHAPDLTEMCHVALQESVAGLSSHLRGAGGRGGAGDHSSLASACAAITCVAVG